jgi:hypothetical protein
MAILMQGKTICPICARLMEHGQESKSFPPFVANELDPLFLFSDAAFHEECFRTHPLAEAAELRVRELRAKTPPNNFLCAHCSQPIRNPDDHFTLGYLVSDRTHPLFVYNCVQLHRGCIIQWPQRRQVKMLLVDFLQSGNWKGASLEWVIAQLQDN